MHGLEHVRCKGGFRACLADINIRQQRPPVSNWKQVLFTYAVHSGFDALVSMLCAWQLHQAERVVLLMLASPAFYECSTA